MFDENFDLSLPVMMIELCRICKPQEHWEGKSSGPISSLKVAVPSRFLEEAMSIIEEGEEVFAERLAENIDRWVEVEFGFPWLVNRAIPSVLLPFDEYEERFINE